jgi:hypothetical protein
MSPRSLFADRDPPPHSSRHLHNNNNIVALVHTTAVATFTTTTTIQGGSDKSGTLSKPHRRFKKSYILIIISHKLSQLFVEAERKTNRHIPAKVNQ